MDRIIVNISDSMQWLSDIKDKVSVQMKAKFRNPNMETKIKETISVSVGRVNLWNFDCLLRNVLNQLKP